MRRALALLALVLACSAVRGAPSTSGEVPAFSRSQPGLLEALLQKPYTGQGNAGRDYTPATNGGVTISDTARGTLPSGKAVDFAVKRKIGAEAARAAMKAVAKNLIPGVGIAVALWEALETEGIIRGADGRPSYDPGQPKAVERGLMVDFRTGVPMYPATIASREADAYCASQSVGGYTCTVLTATGSCSGGVCIFNWSARVFDPNGNFAWNYGGSDQRPEVVDEQCPAANGLPYHDGACPSNDRAPAPPDLVDDAVDRVPPPRLPDILKDLDGAGHPGVQTDDPPVIEGPTTVDDGTVTRTRPDGSVETTRKEWRLEYPGWPTVEFEPRIIEGAPGDETITEGELPESQPPETKTNCEKFPESIGCSEYGEPAEAELDRNTVDIQVNSDSLGDGSCPESPSFQALGRSFTFDLAQLCSVGSTYVRPLVILMAALVAGLIFVGGLKT